MIDLAKVVIWAVDKTKEGTDSAQRNLQGVHNEVDTLKGKLAALGGMLGITAFAAMVKSAIDAQAKIKDLAIEAGMTTEQLSRFEEVGRTSGEGLEGIAAAMGKLSKSMMEAKDPTSAAAQALKAINLSWKDLQGLSPDEQLIKIAKAQAQFGPGLEKNAVMMELFSRGGAKFQVALAEIAEAQQLAATTTNAQGDAADAFNDTLEKLGLRFAKFGRQIANEVLEYLNPLLQAFTELPQTATSTLGVIDILAGAFKYLGGMIGTAWLTLVNLGDGLGAIAAKMVAFFKGDWNGIQEINRQRAENAAKNDEALGKFWARLQGTLKEEKEIKTELRKLDFDPKAGKVRDDELKQYEAANLALDKQIALWRERERLSRQLTESEKELTEIEAGKYAKLTPAHQAELKRKAEEWALDEKRVLVAKDDLAMRVKAYEEIAKVRAAMDEKIDSAKLENETYGLTKAQIERVLIARLEERRAILAATEGAELQVKALDLEIAKRRELVDVYQQADINEKIRQDLKLQLSMWEEISNAAGTFFSDLVMNGRSAFDHLKQMLKDLLAQMIALFAKKWVLQLAAGAVGGSTGTALAGEAANLYSNAGTAGSLISVGYGIYSGYTGASALAAAQAAGTLTTTAGVGVAAAEGGSITAAGIGESLYGALSSIGPYGWMAIAVLAVAAYFSGRGGAPKEGGSFFGSYDPSGSFLGDRSVPGSDNGRFFTPSGGDAGMRQFGDQMAEGFFATLRRLGGTSGGIDFGFGFDRDPGGTADNRVSTLVAGADGSVLYSATSSAGRDDEDLQRVLGIESRRAILAALQASELPQEIADILDDVVAASASVEEIDAVIAAAESMSRVLQGLAAIDLNGLDVEALRAFQRGGETLEETLARVGGQWAAFENLFTTDAERLQQAQDIVTRAFADMGVAIPESKDAFEELVRGLNLSTQADRDLFESLMNVAPAFVAVADASTQAAADAQKAAASIMTSFHSIMAQIRGPAYTQSQNQGLLDSSLGSFRDQNAWASGLSNQDLLGQILTITPEDMADYARLKPESAALINTILSTWHAMQEASTGSSAAVNTFAGAVNDAGDAARIAASKREQEIRIMELTGQSFEALTARREMELAAMDESLRANQLLIWGLEDQARATAAAAELKKKEGDLNIRILELSGDAVGALAARRAIELAATDASLRPLLLRIHGLEDEAEATRIAQDLARKKGDLEIRIMELTGNASGALAAKRKIEMAALDESLRPLQAYIYTLEDQAAAADKAVAAMQEIVQNIDAISAASTELRRTIQGLRETVPGYDIGAARRGAVRDAYSAFSNITSAMPVGERLRLAGNYRDAVLANHEYEMGLLQDKANAEREIYQADLEARRKGADAANALTKAFASLGDVARDLLIGPDSPLTGKQRVAEINRQYAEALTGARGNDLDAVGRLQQLVSPRLQAAKGQAATLVDYQREAARVQRDLAELGARGDRDMIEVIDSGFTISAGLQREMNDLTQDTIDTLGGIDTVLQAWIVEQETALAAEAEVFRSINGGIAQLVLNTAGLDTRIAAAIRGAIGSAPPVSEGDDQFYDPRYFSVPVEGVASYAVGTDYVPFDMVAKIHKGERITPAASNRSDATNQNLVAEVKALRVEVERMRKDTKSLDTTLTRVTRGGDGMLISADSEVPVTVVM